MTLQKTAGRRERAINVAKGPVNVAEKAAKVVERAENGVAWVTRVISEG